MHKLSTHRRLKNIRFLFLDFLIAMTKHLRETTQKEELLCDAVSVHSAFLHWFQAHSGAQHPDSKSMWQRLLNSWIIGSRKKVTEMALDKILAT